MKQNALHPSEGIERTAPPGIMILSRAGKLLYLNRIAKDLLESLREEETLPVNGDTGRSHPNVLSFRLKDPQGNSPFSPLITTLCDLFRKRLAAQVGAPDREAPDPRPFFLKNNGVCFVRALFLQNPSGASEGAHLLILIEAAPFTGQTKAAAYPPLTGREQGVVRLLFDGKTNKEVAAALRISEHTVKEYIKRIMKKLNVTTRTGVATRFAQPLLHRQEKEKSRK